MPPEYALFHPSGFNTQAQFPQEFPFEVTGAVSLLPLAPKSPPLHHLVLETTGPPQATSGTLKNRKLGPTPWILLTGKQDSGHPRGLPPMPLCETQASAIPTGTKWVNLRAIRRPIPLSERRGQDRALLENHQQRKKLRASGEGKESRCMSHQGFTGSLGHQAKPRPHPCSPRSRLGSRQG